MPPFNRLDILPSLELSRQLATRSIANMIPTGFRWFSAESLNVNNELGKHVRSWGESVGLLKTFIERQRYNLLLSTATGPSLDRLGSSLGFTRVYGENDEDFASRIIRELVSAKVTPKAFSDFVPTYTSGLVNSNVYEPWKNIWFFGSKAPLSGPNKFTDQRYYHGGAFEIQVDQVVDNLDYYLNQMKAAGTLPWQALIMNGTVADKDGNPSVIRNDLSGTGVIWPDNGEEQGFSSSSLDVIIESVGTSTNVDVVLLEMPQNIELLGTEVHRLTWTCGLTFDNVSRNYSPAVDMLASYYIDSPMFISDKRNTTHIPSSTFNAWQPTDIQAPVLIKLYDEKIGVADLTLGSPGLVLG